MPRKSERQARAEVIALVTPQERQSGWQKRRLLYPLAMLIFSLLTMVLYNLSHF